MASPSKDDDVQETMITKDIPEDLDCSYYDHHDGMEIVAMTCCKKRVHTKCLETYWRILHNVLTARID